MTPLADYRGRYPHLAEDLDSEAVVAFWEAQRNGRSIGRAVAMALARLVRPVRWEVPGSQLQDRRKIEDFKQHTVSILEIGVRPVPLGPQKQLTDGQRERWERNTVIQAAARAGIPQRHLARVFNVSHSTIAAIIAANLGAVFRDDSTDSDINT